MKIILGIDDLIYSEREKGIKDITLNSFKHPYYLFELVNEVLFTNIEGNSRVLKTASYIGK